MRLNRPNWATSAVYKVLDHELLNQKDGRFNKEDAKTIWSEDEYEFVRDELLRLMGKFFLTYEIDDSGEYIVPERLPAARPEYHWDENDNLFLRYAYDLFMPKGIMSQFTVQMHRYIGNHNHVWTRGVVLEREETTAEIVGSYDARTIRIRIAGENRRTRRDFMTLITEELDGINAQYEKMKVEKLIPCNCENCTIDDQPYFFECSKLNRRLDNSIYEIDCENSFKKVDIRSLIDDVISEDVLISGARDVTSTQIKRQPEQIKRDRVFVSYSQKDKDWLERVQTNLKVLKNLDINVNLWDDTQIEAGQKWREEIKKALSAAKVAILLVSTDFLASDFISSIELPRLLKAAKKDGATILPLILRPCLYRKHKELSEFQAVNDPSKPLSKLTESERDEILVALAERIVELIKENG
jgi:hypothetical protein